MHRAVFLDRDGVLNESQVIDGIPLPPRTIDQVEIIAGVEQAIEILKLYNFIPVVVTNQPDMARGTVLMEQILAINNHVGRLIGVEHFYTCFHDDEDRCPCRKPQPGLIHMAAKELGIDIKSSYLVGDRWRDVAAGQAAGCKSFFIDYSYSEKEPGPPFIRVSSLLEATKLIVGERDEEK